MTGFWNGHWGWAALALLVMVVIKNYALKAGAANGYPVTTELLVGLAVLDVGFVVCVAFKIVKKVKQSRLARQVGQDEE